MAHPQLVGNSFVSQYYNVLHQSPQVVHRFYTDASSLTRAEVGPEAPAETVYGQNRIHEKVMSMDYMGLRAEIKTVDCQNSYSGSVLVMVTGSLYTRSHEKRDFVQTFFLAPQVKGYFVYNDIFRYIGEPQMSDSGYIIPNGVQEHSPTPESVDDPVHLDVSESAPAAPEDEVDEVYDLPQDVPQQEDVEEDVPAQESVNLETDEAVDTEDLKDLPKKSYASILRVMKDGHVQNVSQPQKSTPVPAEKSVPVTASPQATQTSSPALPPPVETAEGSPAAQDVQGEGKAIYIKSLPMNITVAQLEEEFKRFGAVKPGCTNVKKQQNVCYAFMEFEDANAARVAVQTSTIQINGKSVFIEDKKPLGSRGGYRGRGRGRGDGTRGRGYYGGRGVGSGGRNYEPTGRGRGGPRGGYHHSSSFNQDRSSYANNNTSSTNDDNSSYHPRYDHNNTQNYQSNNSNGSGSHREGSSNNYGSHPRSRRYSRNSSFGRNSHQASAPAPATLTAA